MQAVRSVRGAGGAPVDGVGRRGVCRPQVDAIEPELNRAVATAGGLQEYANKKNIRIIRDEGGQQRSFRFNYNDVLQGRNLQQNILLKPGDTVLVP